MKSPIILRLLAIVPLVALLSCSRSGTGPDTETVSVEALDMALCLSGEIEPPLSMAQRLQSDLIQIRRNFGGGQEILRSIIFVPPWAPGHIIVSFDEATALAVQQGTYHDWDALNDEYGLEKIDQELLESIGAVVLHFEGRIHPRVAGERYRELPGVRHVQPNNHTGDRPNIYPRLVEGGVTYLFRNAWGDCPSGCLHAAYWYFEALGNRPELVGSWNPTEEPSEPAWWGEAEQNIHQYQEW